MRFSEFVGMLMRWKWVIIAGTVVAAVAGATVFVQGVPTYTRTANYLLLAPVETPDGPSNPFLYLDNGVEMTASVLAAKLMDGETATALTAQAPGVTYLVGLNPEVNAPLIAARVTDTDQDAVDATLADIGSRLARELADLQRVSGAPQNTWVTLQEVINDPRPTASRATPLRNALGAALGCELLALGLVALLERRRLRRRESLSADPEIPANAGPTDRRTSAPATSSAVAARVGDRVGTPVPSSAEEGSPGLGTDGRLPEDRPHGNATSPAAEETIPAATR
jgi:hypothetical protein